MIPIYVINLDRATDRIRVLSKVLHDLGLPFTRIPAVDGNDLSEDDIHEHYDQAKATSYKYDLTNGEIGCYLSHKSVWEEIINSGQQSAVILEDDARPGNRFNEALTEVRKVTERFSNDSPIIIKLHTGRTVKPRQSLSRLKFRWPYRVPYYSVAYFINRRACEILLEKRAKFFRPTDDDIRHWWETGIRPQIMVPQVADHVGEESYINSERALRRLPRYRYFKRKIYLEVMNFVHVLLFMLRKH